MCELRKCERTRAAAHCCSPNAQTHIHPKLCQIYFMNTRREVKRICCGTLLDCHWGNSLFIHSILGGAGNEWWWWYGKAGVARCCATEKTRCTREISLILVCPPKIQLHVCVCVREFYTQIYGVFSNKVQWTVVHCMAMMMMVGVVWGCSCELWQSKRTF